MSPLGHNNLLFASYTIYGNSLAKDVPLAEIVQHGGYEQVWIAALNVPKTAHQFVDLVAGLYQDVGFMPRDVLYEVGVREAHVPNAGVEADRQHEAAREQLSAYAAG